MSTPLKLQSGRRADGRPVLTADGEIDMTNLARFSAALTEAVAGGGPVVVDLTSVTYLDSGAIHAMYGHAEQLQLVCNRLLLRALTFSGLAGVVDRIDVDPLEEGA